MNKSIIFDKNKHNSQDIRRWHKEGYDILCPTCQSKLIVILDLEESKVKKPGHPGVFCPVDTDHFYLSFNMGSKAMWELFEKKMNSQ